MGTEEAPPWPVDAIEFMALPNPSGSNPLWYDGHVAHERIAPWAMNFHVDGFQWMHINVMVGGKPINEAETKYKLTSKHGLPSSEKNLRYVCEGLAWDECQTIQNVSVLFEPMTFFSKPNLMGEKSNFVFYIFKWPNKTRYACGARTVHLGLLDIHMFETLVGRRVLNSVLQDHTRWSNTWNENGTHFKFGHGLALNSTTFAFNIGIVAPFPRNFTHLFEAKLTLRARSDQESVVSRLPHQLDTIITIAWAEIMYMWTLKQLPTDTQQTWNTVLNCPHIGASKPVYPDWLLAVLPVDWLLNRLPYTAFPRAVHSWPTLSDYYKKKDYYSNTSGMLDS